MIFTVIGSIILFWWGGWFIVGAVLILLSHERGFSLSKGELVYSLIMLAVGLWIWYNVFSLVTIDFV